MLLHRQKTHTMKEPNNSPKPGTSEPASEAEKSQAFLTLMQCADMLDAAREGAHEWNRVQMDENED
jgi:hypothetical protein